MSLMNLNFFVENIKNLFSIKIRKIIAKEKCTCQAKMFYKQAPKQLQRLHQCCNALSPVSLKVELGNASASI